MAYTEKNFKTKKALVEAVQSGEKVTLKDPMGVGRPVFNGTEVIEGPHYPEPHRWYAKVTLKGGVVVKVQ